MADRLSLARLLWFTLNMNMRIMTRPIIMTTASMTATKGLSTIMNKRDRRLCLWASKTPSDY